VGRILSRREALALLGTASAAVLAACAAPAATQSASAPTAAPTTASEPTATAAPVNTAEATAAPEAAAATSAKAAMPACVVSPEMTEGPYFVDEKLNRSDIRTNTADGSASEGTPLQLTLRVAAISSAGCAPLAGALVDIWHCDAAGVYSDASDRSFNTQGQDFLRGYQVTDANGAVTFTTIYPGWYPGRAVHIHFKVRNDPAASKGFEFTSQFFFDEAQSEQVFARAPYASKGSGFLRNASDNIFNGGGGQTTLSLIKDEKGYASTFDIGVQV
jgi:protocatechuate 3,4-dioxygenase beta subunit